MGKSGVKVSLGDTCILKIKMSGRRERGREKGERGEEGKIEGSRNLSPEPE